METFLGILIPFLGTTLGAACVFFMKKSLGDFGAALRSRALPRGLWWRHLFGAC